MSGDFFKSQTRRLDGINILSELDPGERERITQNCHWHHYSNQEQIIDRQNITTDVYFIVQGTVRVVNYSLSGREITLDDLTVGDSFGELAAIDSQPRSASVMALTDCSIASLGQAQFLTLLKTQGSVAIRVMELMARVIRTSTARIMDLSTLAANNRVQAELLRQAKSRDNIDNTSVIKPIPIHSDIASRVSTTRETVTRVLSDLTRNGILERQRGGLKILDVERLQDMVEEVRGE